MGTHCSYSINQSLIVVVTVCVCNWVLGVVAVDGVLVVRDHGVLCLVDGAAFGSQLNVGLLVLALHVGVEVSWEVVHDGVIANNVWLISLVWVVGHALNEVSWLLVVVCAGGIVGAVGEVGTGVVGTVVDHVVIFILGFVVVLLALVVIVVWVGSVVDGGVANKVVIVILGLVIGLGLTFVIVVVSIDSWVGNGGGGVADKVVIVVFRLVIGLGLALIVVAPWVYIFSNNGRVNSMGSIAVATVGTVAVWVGNGVVTDKVVVLFLLVLGLGLTLVVVVVAVAVAVWLVDSGGAVDKVVVVVSLDLVVVVSDGMDNGGGWDDGGVVVP